MASSEKHDLITLPPKETLLVEPMPAFKRGSAAAEYLAPGVLENRPKWHATYYIDPIDPTWPKPLPSGWITGRLGGVCSDGHDVSVLPLAAPASTIIQGPWQIDATGLPESKKCFTNSTAFGFMRSLSGFITPPGRSRAS